MAINEPMIESVKFGKIIILLEINNFKTHIKKSKKINISGIIKCLMSIKKIIIKRGIKK